MSHPSIKGPYLTTAEAAAALKISPATLKRWAQSGLIPSERTEGGHRRFRAEDLRGVAEPLATSDDPVRRGADFVAGSTDSLSLQGWLIQARRELGSWWAVAQPLRGVVAELYRRREGGAVGGVQLEAALDRLRCALVHFGDSIPASLDAPRLLVAAVPGDPYLVAPALIQLAAQESGWRAEWAGHPAAPELAEELRRRPARALVVCGSVAMDAGVVDLHARGLARLAAELALPTAILGLGLGRWQETARPLRRFAAVAELRSWLEELQGGAAAPGAAAPRPTSAPRST